MVPDYRPPRLPGKGWVLVAAGGFRLVPGERYELAVRGAGLVDEAEYISAVCDGPRSFQGIEWGRRAGLPAPLTRRQDKP